MLTNKIQTSSFLPNEHEDVPQNGGQEIGSQLLAQFTPKGPSSGTLLSYPDVPARQQNPNWGKIPLFTCLLESKDVLGTLSADFLIGRQTILTMPHPVVVCQALVLRCSVRGCSTTGGFLVFGMFLNSKIELRQKSRPSKFKKTLDFLKMDTKIRILIAKSNNRTFLAAVG